VPNPHFDPDTAANLPRTVEVAPSAFAAGLWARIDGKRGVWKAPAGLEADIRGMLGPAVVVGDDVQDNLNEWGVNCIRSIIGPPVIWGARTLATKAKPEDRYVPVRRTALMIGESLYNSLQAVVFEPNSHVLWSSLRAGVGDFMNQLFRAGAFQGEKVSDAYYVRCGLGDTMTQADIDSGIVRVVVGFAPLRPAEFVVVEIKKILRQS
jgi:phage tail sheath protein FI